MFTNPVGFPVVVVTRLQMRAVLSLISRLQHLLLSCAVDLPILRFLADKALFEKGVIRLFKNKHRVVERAHICNPWGFLRAISSLKYLLRFYGSCNSEKPLKSLLRVANMGPLNNT
jgi:hypothetical protein